MLGHQGGSRNSISMLNNSNEKINYNIKDKRPGNDGAKSAPGMNKTVTISQYCSCSVSPTPSSGGGKMGPLLNRIEYRMKERTSTINEDPSSHEEHPSNQLPKPESSTTVTTGSITPGKSHAQRAVLTKNPSFAMRSLTTRLSGFFRKFSISSSVSGVSQTDVSEAGSDVCPVCHLLVRRPLTDKSVGLNGAGLAVASGGKKAKRDDGEVVDDDTIAEEEVDFTSNILVGELGNLTSIQSILKKPSAFRQISLDDDDSNKGRNPL